MNCKGKTNYKFTQKFDLFGKNIGLYYKGSEKRNTYFGSIFSLAFMVLYLSYFTYRIVRMIKREDVIFYDTFENPEQPPSIHLTKDLFYGGFAVENPITYDPFIDETIYYPKAYFKRGVRNGDKWNFEIKDIELERCKIGKFGKAFQDKVIHNALNDLYCFKELDENLEGHFSYDYYSFIYIQFFPCVNSSENNNHCKPVETIDYYLNNTFICFEMEDIELTPQNYTSPVRGRNQDIYFTVGKKLFQEVHVFYQLINIETDLDIIGFNKLKNMKEQKFLKYYSQIQMTNLLENNIYTTGEAFSAVTLKLFDEVRIQKRTYTTILEVLGNVGGFMEVLFLFFRMICTFSINILYELSLVNNLFEFDINKKEILINNKSKKDFYEGNQLNDNRKINFHKKFEYSNIDYNNEKLIKIIKFDRKRANNLMTNNRTSVLSEKSKDIINNIDKSSFVVINKIQNNSLFDNNKKNKYESDRYNSYENIIKKYKREQFKINKIYFNRIHICISFCFIRKRKNIQNILLDEDMRIIIEKMDITNVFKKIIMNEDEVKKLQTIKMSGYCRENLRKLNERLI